MTSHVAWNAFEIRGDKPEKQTGLHVKKKKENQNPKHSAEEHLKMLILKQISHTTKTFLDK